MLCYKEEELSKPILICFHANCTDGFTSAVIAFNVFGYTADYFAVQYGKEYNLEIFKDKEIYIFDFSFSREFCEEINNVSKSLLILDHHKTAEENLKDLSYAKFDMTKSGALMTWEYFNPNQSPPLPVQWVSDNDLWQFKLSHTKPFSKIIRTYEFNLEKWKELFNLLDSDLNAQMSFINEGFAIDRFTNQQVIDTCRNATKCIIGGNEGLIVNCSPVFSSEVGNTLARQCGTYGATFIIKKDGKAIISLRSDKTTETHIDVSSLAKQYGGGGHFCASGFSIELSKLKFIDNVLIID